MSGFGWASHSGVSWRAGIVFAAGILFTACTASPVVPSPSATASSGSKPTVVIQAPVNGAVVPLGQSVAVAGAASDTVGIDHVALFADGVGVAGTPSAQPVPLAPFSLSWLATPAGPHVLQVIAYRADGTSSDPQVVNVVVGAGAGGSGLLFGSPGASLPALPGLSLPTLPPPPPPTKKPKPSTTPKPIQPTTAPATSAPTSLPADTPTAVPLTPAPTLAMTPAPNGIAPDDTTLEPHEIVINNCGPTVFCVADVPISAVGGIQEQISAPTGDVSDQLFFRPNANTWYKVQMTSCSDTSDTTEWFSPPKDQNTLSTGCGDWLIFSIGDTPPATVTIDVDFNAVAQQTYNLYTFSVYQCTFSGCGSQ